jgi:branched-chain amino acid aminotransferase
MKQLQNSDVYFRNKFIPFNEANLSIASAPMLYGLSTYTVFPVFWNEQQQKRYLFRLEDHFKRLQNSAKILAFDDFLEKWDYEKFVSIVKQLVINNDVQQDALVRVTIFVDAILSGTRMQGLAHEMAAFVYPVTSLLPSDGAKLCVSSWRRTPDNAIPARAKINGSYVNASLMKNEALVNGFDDAIALDELGHVAESTVSNIFIVRGGNIITPSGSTDLLEGITRDTVFHLADDMGIHHEQRSIDRSELYLADEVFLSGSSMRLSPVSSIDNRTIGDGTIGPVTKQLLECYESTARKQTSSHDSWLTLA